VPADPPPDASRAGLRAYRITRPNIVPPHWYVVVVEDTVVASTGGARVGESWSHVRPTLLRARCTIETVS
jgi:hypothetical protein